MSIKGFSVGGVVQRYDYTALDNLPQGQGVSDDLKAALLQLAQKVAYIDDQGQTYYDDLYDALYPEKTLLSITANFQQGQAVVYNTDSLDSLKQYLTVTAIYDDASTETVPSSAYTLSGTLTTGTSVITVTYEGKTDAFNVVVTAAPIALTVTNNLTGCTTSNSATSVLENTSYTAVITASSGYTLVGATVSITMGGNDITTSAYSGGIITINSVTGALVISVAAAAVVLNSISAVYTQSGTVYTDDTIDSLKSDLVVTAHYSDSSTQTVPAADYTLSGTLTAGTSTITVSYGGKTTTFSVTVTSRYELFDYIYSTRVDSDPSEYVDTGLTYAPSFTALNVEMEVMNSRNISNNEPLFGQWDAPTGSLQNTLWYCRGNKAGFSAFNLGQAKQLTTVPGDTRAILKYFFVDGGESYMQWQDTTVAVATVNKSSIPTNTSSLVIAGGYGTASPYAKWGFEPGAKTKLGYIKFTNPANGILLYHFIPAHDVIADKWGFYEAVNGIFYPSNGTKLRCANWEA